MSIVNECSNIGEIQVKFNGNILRILRNLALGKFKENKHTDVSHYYRLIYSLFVVSISIIAYRKLPYELGPLPPLQPDCCILSKLAAIKATKQQKTKRGLKLNHLKRQQSTSDEIHVKKEVIDDDGDSVDTTNLASNLSTRSKPKTDVNIVTSSSSNSSSSGNNINAGNCTSVTNNKSTSISSMLSDENNKNERRPQTSTLSQLLLADSSLNSISLPASISNKKKGMLLDAFGQPRKSPREHASTLAILSSLVQQRRKRFKEMNGGISPEKMPCYRAAVAAAIAAQQSSAENSGNDDNDEIADDFDERYQQQQQQLTIKSSETKIICSPTTRRRSNQTPVFELSKNLIETSENSPRRSSMEVQSDKFFRLRKGKRRQTESVSSNAESTTDKTDRNNGTNEEKIKEIDTPKMPIDDYIDPNKIARELDELLSSCYSDVENDLNDLPVKCSDTDCSDLILVSSPKDFIEIVETVKSGPLTYRSLQRGKKRHINKTGWPSLPKKRLPKREKHDETINTDDDGQPSITNDDEPERLTDIDEEEIDVDKNRIMRSDHRRLIRTPFCDDNAVQFAVFASSSEKAENSDIFTVSSDSFLDTDINDTVNTSKSRLTPITNSLVSFDRLHFNTENYLRLLIFYFIFFFIVCYLQPKMGSASHITEDDGEISDDTTANEDILREVCNSTPTTSARPTSILERALMSTRSKNVRSPTIKDAINLKLQPLVCVQKISDKDLPQKSWLNNQSQVQSEQVVVDVIQVEESKPNNRTNSSPKTKTSPRKLRKPRGRWYRER